MSKYSYSFDISEELGRDEVLTEELARKKKYDKIKDMLDDPKPKKVNKVAKKKPKKTNKEVNPAEKTPLKEDNTDPVLEDNVLPTPQPSGAGRWLFFLLLVAAAVAVAISKYLTVIEEINDEQFIIAAVLVMIFLLSYGAQASGVAAAAGAFIAGLILNKTQFTESVITPKIGTISHGFFIPLFFAYSALLAGSVNVQFALALLVAAGLVKFLVSAGAGSYHGLNRQEQATFGISMLPRGEISVIACYVALSMSIISAEIYSSLLSFVVLSIVSTAVLFRALVKRW